MSENIDYSLENHLVPIYKRNGKLLCMGMVLPDSIRKYKNRLSFVFIPETFIKLTKRYSINKTNLTSFCFAAKETAKGKGKFCSFNNGGIWSLFKKLQRHIITSIILRKKTYRPIYIPGSNAPTNVLGYTR